MNVIARLEFELAYYDSSFHRFNHLNHEEPLEEIKGTLHAYRCADKNISENRIEYESRQTNIENGLLDIYITNILIIQANYVVFAVWQTFFEKDIYAGKWQTVWLIDWPIFILGNYMAS